VGVLPFDPAASMREPRLLGRCFRTLGAPLLLLLLPSLLPAQSGPGTVLGGGGGDRSHAAAPRAQATRTAQPIEVDGRLDEEVWTSARPVTEFTQTDPAEGRPVSERTEVRIVYDDQAVYVGAVLHDTGPITTRLARRDAMVADSDFFIVLIDSYHDHQTAYRFATNPSGMKRDEIVSGGGGGGGRGGGGGGFGGFGDTSWDPIWDVATAVTDSGWVAEMRIPFSQLRFSTDEHQVWGLQIERKINRKQETAVFSFTPKVERGGVARYGHLEGIQGIRPGRKLELLPYVGSRAEYRQAAGAAGVDFANPFRGASDYFANAGLDLKYRISSNLTLDATANPDFGQVEMDPAEINLTAFETQFEEKRPFFVEGAEIFRFGDGGPVGSTGRGPQLLYSRRIGRKPQSELPGAAVFHDAPGSTTILGAAKVTGRIGNGWSVGLLEAVTGRETARYVDAAGSRGEAVLEPATSYLVGRLRRDLRGGGTRFGLIATSVNRDLSDPVLADRLRAEAYSAGVDLNHEWANRTWRFNSSFSPSYVAGSTAAILRTQRSSARYFHRPDADHLRVDSAATAMAGYHAMVDLNKQAGTYQAKVALAAASPGYEVNDLGFQTAADRIILDTNFQYERNRPGRVFRRWDVRGGPDAIWNYGGDRIFTDLNVFATWQLTNYWGGGARLAYNPPTADDRLTRGGPLARSPRSHAGNLFLSSDSRQRYVMRGNYQWRVEDEGSWRSSGNLNLTYKPWPTWEIRLGPELARSHVAAQYVTQRADPLATRTHGRRYVFAGLDQTTLGVETRVNVTFSPALSFELYAQPFVSNGDYGALREFRAPGTFEFLTYGEELGTVARQANGYYRVDPDGDGPAASFLVQDLDFNYRSLLGNAVLRWEWRPGSTLFLVWQQSRARTVDGLEIDPELQRIGNFDLGRDTRELLGIRPDNIFLVKVNYWLNP
jgi:hypothetical protein